MLCMFGGGFLLGAIFRDAAARRVEAKAERYWLGVARRAFVAEGLVATARATARTWLAEAGPAQAPRSPAAVRHKLATELLRRLCDAEEVALARDAEASSDVTPIGGRV